MHELRIAEDLSTIVLEAAAREHLSKVIRVSITFGQLISVVPEIFEPAFRESVRETIAEEAELCLEVLPVKLRCKWCGNDFPLDSNLFSCAVCGLSDIDIIQGKELFVKSIEGE